jgi:hypothetical protein
MIGGSMLGSTAGEAIMARAAAKKLPSFIQNSIVGKTLASWAPKATEDISKGTHISSTNSHSNFMGSMVPQAGMFGGMAAADPIIDPIASRFENEGQPQQPQEEDMNYLSQQQPTSYNEPQYGNSNGY